MRFFIFFVFISILNPILAEPTCSREDKVYFLNGVNNTTQEAVDNLSKLKIILKDEKNNKKVSKNKLLDKDFKLLYNTKLGVADFAEVLALKLEEIGAKDPWDVAGKIFFKSATYSKKEIEEDFGSSLKYLNPFDVKWKLFSDGSSPYEYYVTIDLQDQQEFTISQLGSTVKNDLISGSKAIVISHSQGGLITNKVYDYLFKDGVQSQDFEEKYEPYFANAQFGTAAGSIRTDPSGSEYVTLDTDNVVGVLSDFGQSLGLRTLLPNYRIDTSKRPFGQLVDFLKGHSFSSVYAGDLFINGGGTLDSKMASEVLIETLASAVSKMPPNCCINANNELVAETLVPYGGGYVSTALDSIPATLELSQGATICSGVTGLNNVKLDGNIFVSGNTEINNCNFVSRDGLVNVVGLGNLGIQINGSESNNKDLSITNDGGTNLSIIGDNISIGGFGHITSEGTSNLIGHGVTIELINDSEFGVSYLSLKDSEISRTNISLSKANRLHYPKKLMDCLIVNSSIVTDLDNFECLENSSIKESVIIDASLTSSNVTNSSLSMPNGEMVYSLTLKDGYLSPLSLGTGVQVLGPNVDVYGGHINNNVFISSNGELDVSELLLIEHSTISEGGAIIGHSYVNNSTIGTGATIQNSYIRYSKIDNLIVVNKSDIQGVPLISSNKNDNECNLSNYNLSATKEISGEIYYNKCFNGIQWLIDKNIENRLWF